MALCVLPSETKEQTNFPTGTCNSQSLKLGYLSLLLPLPPWY